jgi:peptidoglycan/xylan/chitin deacetylase (PgdA/CDA1 family)
MINKVKSLIFFFLSPFVVKRLKSQSVFLTFDDGPHPENTQKIINILKHFNVKASFFLSGKEMDKYPHIVKELYDSGNTLCYHSYYHDHAKEKSFSSFYDELKKVSEYEKNIGVKFKKFYRPPYGELTVSTLTLLIILRWKVLLWSVDSRDSFDEENEVLQNVNSSNVSAGDILLFHDDYDKTVRLLPVLLERYHQSGISCDKL